MQCKLFLYVGGCVDFVHFDTEAFFDVVVYIGVPALFDNQRPFHSLSEFPPVDVGWMVVEFTNFPEINIIGTFDKIENIGRI